MNNLIDDILTDWSYRVPNGMPDPKNPYHLIKLDEAMTSMKLPNGFKHGLLKKLREIDFASQSAFKDYNKKHKMRPDTKVSIGGQETTAGEAEGSEKTKEVQSNGYVGDKDKSVKQGDPNQSEEYNRDLEPDDDIFNEKNKNDVNPTPPSPISLDCIIKNPKFRRRTQPR